MAYEWKDKVVLITGAAAGIGALVVRKLVKFEKVKHVTIIDVNQEGAALAQALNEIFGDGKVAYFKCDITKDDELDAAFKWINDKFGHLDVLINNAGIMNDSYQVYKKMVDVNVTALFTCTLKAQEIMRKDEGGRGGTIINTASIAALKQHPTAPMYCATKSAVLQFTLCLSHVTILDLNEEGSTLAQELNNKFGAGKVNFLKCDITKDDQVDAGFKWIKDRFGHLDVLLNNAGIMNDSYQTYKKMVEVNVTALYTCTLKALEIMRKDEGGRGGTIINTASIASLLQHPITPMYFGTKSAVLQFTLCLSLDDYYSRTGVRLMTICYGATGTALLTRTKLGNFDKDIESRLEELVKEFYLQNPDNAAVGLVDTYKYGENGSTWISTHDRPVKDITEEVTKAYKILSDTTI